MTPPGGISEYHSYLIFPEAQGQAWQVGRQAPVKDLVGQKFLEGLERVMVGTQHLLFLLDITGLG